MGKKNKRSSQPTKLGVKILEWKNEVGSMEKAGAIIGVSDASIHNWIHGINKPYRRDHLDKIADVLGIKVEEAFLLMRTPASPDELKEVLSLGGLCAGVIPRRSSPFGKPHARHFGRGPILAAPTVPV